MKSIYLNSLHSLVFENNPFLQIGRNSFKTVRAFWNLRRNMAYARVRVAHMEHQLQTVETYINTPATGPRHRFDVTR